MTPPAKINGIPFAKIAKMTPEQQVKVCGDELPPFLYLSEDQRRVAREKSPITVVAEDKLHSYRPSWRSDADHEDFIRAQEEAKMAKQAATEAKTEKTPKPEKAKRPSREGLITAGDIAKELKIAPRELRVILRASDEKKPAEGWCGDKDWAKRIKAIAEKALKEPKKAKANGAPKRKGKVKIDPESTLWSGKGKTKNGNNTADAKKLGKGPQNIIDKKAKEAGKRTLVATFMKERKKWKLAVDDVTIRDSDTSKVMFFDNAKACTDYAKAHYGTGVAKFVK